MKELDYLLDTYYNKEDWHESRLPQAEAKQYYEEQIKNKNIEFLKDKGKIVGYLEIWFLDKEQTERIIAGEFFDCLKENITDGLIAYVQTAYIEKEHRGKRNLMKLNKDLQYKHKDGDWVGIMYQDGHNKGSFTFHKRGEI